MNFSKKYCSKFQFFISGINVESDENGFDRAFILFLKIHVDPLVDSKCQKIPLKLCRMTVQYEFDKLLVLRIPNEFLKCFLDSICHVVYRLNDTKS